MSNSRTHESNGWHRALVLMALLLIPLRVPGADTRVNIVDFAFDPASVNIQVNESVIWSWVGPTPHTATSTTGLWDSGFMSSAAPQFTYTFKSGGSFPYYCALHPFMTASVTVKASPASGADIGISLISAPNPVVVSNLLIYTLVITNAGPADAPGVVVTDSLPSSVSFQTATVSQGNSAQSAAVWRWDAGSLASGSSATASIVVLPLAEETLINTASVSLNDTTVVDPAQANNGATVTTSVGGTGSTNVSIQVLGTVEFDRQTGLFEQSVRFSNVTSNTVAALRIAVLDLPPDVRLYNASGSLNGLPFIEYDHAVVSGAHVDLVVEYYRSNRLDFAATNFAATAVVATTPALPTGVVLQLDRDPFFSNGRLVIEFAAVPGKTYAVEYSSNMQRWIAAIPPITAAGSRVQWIDNGPPKTESVPGPPGSRFYRVVQLP